MENLTPLNKTELKEMNGGATIFEAIAWYYGAARGFNKRLAATIDYDDVDWEKTRALVGG